MKQKNIVKKSCSVCGRTEFADERTASVVCGLCVQAKLRGLDSADDLVMHTSCQKTDE